MLIAEVAAGRWARGNQGDKTCPLLPGERFKRCGSLVNDEENPAIFVVLHPSAAYPTYLISYQRIRVGRDGDMAIMIVAVVITRQMVS